LQGIKQPALDHPPKDVDQEVERKLEGSIEKNEIGSWTTSAKREEEVKVVIATWLLLG